MKESVYPCLWFDGQAHEAAEFYVDIFPNSEILSKTPMVAIYRLNGARFMNLNGGPEVTFNEAVSLVIPCENQDEVDHYWTHLSAGGKEGKAGWVTDKFGVSWQVAPTILSQLMRDPEKAPKVMYAFMQMKKLVIEDLIKAAEG